MLQHIVQVETKPRPYPVVIGPGVLAQVGPRLRECVKGRRALVITDANVGPLYGESALASLRSAGFEATLLTMPAGEKTKSLESLATI
jgi:3-dehydroquinate synthase